MSAKLILTDSLFGNICSSDCPGDCGTRHAMPLIPHGLLQVDSPCIGCQRLNKPSTCSGSLWAMENGLSIATKMLTCHRSYMILGSRRSMTPSSCSVTKNICGLAYFFVPIMSADDSLTPPGCIRRARRASRAASSASLFASSCW